MKKITFLIVIVLLGTMLRIFLLSSRPLGFTWDEAAIGYNAYSLLKTGKDEHGQALPIILKSFGDYKPGLYAYLTVPTLVVGLNEFATRLPAALMGIIAIPLVYMFVGRLYGKKVGIFSSFLAAINPWLIHFSRGAWEANVSLVITLLGAVLFQKGKYLLSGIFFGLTLWTYQGAKLSTALFVLILIFFNRASLNFKKLSWLFIPVLLFSLPIMFGWSTQTGRLKVFSALSYTRGAETINEILRQDNSVTKDVKFYTFHSEILDQGRGIAQRYFNHLSAYYIFFAGDWTNLRHSIPYYGYMHLPEIASVLIGLIILIKNKNYAGLILGLLLVAPIPAALSRDLVSGVRSLSLVLPLLVLSGIGLEFIYSKKKYFAIYALILCFSILYFLDLYFVHAPQFTAIDWLYPYKAASTIVKDNYSQYNKIVFTPKFGQPYIFQLFYSKFDPNTYQSQMNFSANLQGDVGDIKSFDKFEFRPIYWPEDRKLTSTLFVGAQYELPENDLATTPNLIDLGQINNPNGSFGLRIVGIK